LASSTVITPSLPTFFIASAISLPIALSPLAEIVPTWPISSEVWTFLHRDVDASSRWDARRVRRFSFST
jgi:hypothetical protein